MIQIVYENDDVCVINKPAGVITNNAESSGIDTVQEWFKSKILNPKSQIQNESEFLQKGGIVHRLDKDTSGVMILAKTEVAYEFLKKQFLERTTQKTYCALVHGILKEKEGILSAPVERHSKNKHKFAVGTDLSRTAITEWKVLHEYSRFNNQYSMVELKPHTGRTHQLRVHMKHLNHPIVSDPIYGGKGYKKDVVWCPRLFLHAKSLEILLPGNPVKSVFETELPVDLNLALGTLK